MILELTAAAMGGGIVGFIACAALTTSKLSEAMDRLGEANQCWDDWELTAVGLTDDLCAADMAHARCADALTTKQTRIDRALACVTIKAIWESMRENNLSRQRILEIRDEAFSIAGLKALANGPILNADGPQRLRMPRKRQKALPLIQLSILDIVDGHMGRTA